MKGLRLFLFVFLLLLVVADIAAYFVLVNIIRRSSDDYTNDRYSTVNSFIEKTKKSFDRYSSTVDFINFEQDFIRKDISERNVHAYYITDSTIFPILTSKSFSFDQKYIRNFFLPILKDNLSMRYFIDDNEVYSFKVENKTGKTLFAVFVFKTGNSYMKRVLFYFLLYRIIIILFILLFAFYAVMAIEKPLKDISLIAKGLNMKVNGDDQLNVVKVFRDSIEKIIEEQKESSSQLKSLEEKYDKMERDYLSREGLVKLSEITNGIAHQLNNQLGGIIGLMQAAERRGDPALYGEAYGQLKVLSDFTRKFLEFAGSTKVYFSDVALHEVIAASSSRCGIMIEGETVKTNVKSDMHLLEQIFINVFDNISKYSGDSKAEIRVSEVPNLTTVRIKDFGKGYPDEVLNNLYSPFMESSKGYGLGIPTILKLASLMGHNAKFRNEDGRGVFEISFARRGSEN